MEIHRDKHEIIIRAETDEDFEWWLETLAAIERDYESHKRFEKEVLQDD